MTEIIGERVREWADENDYPMEKACNELIKKGLKADKNYDFSR